jgi:hypothetical protein
MFVVLRLGTVPALLSPSASRDSWLRISDATLTHMPRNQKQFQEGLYMQPRAYEMPKSPRDFKNAVVTQNV